MVFLKKSGQKTVSIFQAIRKSFYRRRSVATPAETVDHQLVYSLSPKKIPSFKQLKHVGKFLKPQEYLRVKILLGVIAVCLLFLIGKLYKDHLQIGPAAGGAYIEAMVGAPKYINPLYNYNRGTDSDLSALIYSGLFRRDADGVLQNDLADKWDVSADGKTYTITLKKNLKFQNGDDLTVSDVIFTFTSIKDPAYNSPWSQVFAGVDINQVDDQTISFTLGEPYAAFRDLLTFGILPQTPWQTITPDNANLAELNLKPIGSGPYEFKSLTKDQDGNIKEYTLVPNNYYSGDHLPYIKTLTFKFYPDINEAVAALNNNSVDGLSYLPLENKKDVLAKNSLNFNNLSYPQVAAIFFNQKSNPALPDKNVRMALALAVDKNKIIKDVFNNSAVAISGPILPNNFAYDKNITTYDYNLDQANQILDKDGYKKITISADEAKKIATLTPAQISTDSNLALEVELQKIASSSQLDLVGDWRVKMATHKGYANLYLTMELTTTDSGANAQAAQEIKSFWEALGVKTSVKTEAAAQIESDVIRPRNFEALLFSQLVGADPDLYGFWHSSQAGGQGLNIADYKNKDVDALLESARLTTDQDQRLAKYQKFQEILTNDLPAIFLYSPTYLYVQGKKLQGLNTNFITQSSDRFSNVINWFVKTKKKLVF